MAYIGTDPLSNQTGIDYSYSKLGSCDPDGYCWDIGLMNRYRAMLAFGFMGSFMLAGQGVNVWRMRVKYIAKENMTKCHS